MGYATTQRMAGPGGGAMAAGPTRAIPGYEYGPEEDEYTQPGGGMSRRAWLLWGIGALLVLAVLGGVAYAFFGGSGGVAVPQVTSLPVAQATAQVKQAGLVPKVVETPSATVQKGLVIGASPPEGSLVARGTTVTLKVSTGPPKVTVPGVVGQSEPDAHNALVNKGFQVREVTDQNSTAPPNTVVKQNPKAGTLASHGSLVTITVSAGGAQVPNVINQQVDAAKAALAAQGFNHVQIDEVSSPGLPDGTVVNQSPQPGTTVPTSTTIILGVVKNEPTPTPTPTSPSPSPTATPTTGGG